MIGCPCGAHPQPGSPVMNVTQIATAPSSQLYARANELRYETPGPHTPERLEAIWSEIDQIEEELAGRAHDLEDPSSGLGCHPPT
jgi:hypothetical protein